MAKKLVTAYVYDADLRFETNQQGRKHWYEYIKEINEQLVLCAQEISINDLLMDSRESGNPQRILKESERL
jgi:hypothetical protein